MHDAKRVVREILDRLPDDCTIEDVQYYLYVAETIRRRLELTKTEDLIPQAEVESRLERWLIR